MGRRKKLPKDFDGVWTEDLLSKREQDILAFVRKFMVKHSYAPSVREIGAAVGLSSSASVHHNLVQLQNKGFLTRNASCSRALNLTDIKKSVELNVLDKAGGKVIDKIIFSVDLIGDINDVFVYRECNDYKKYNIWTGDYIFCKVVDKISDGDMVVVGTRTSAPKIGRYMCGANEYFIEYEDGKVSYSFSEYPGLIVYGVVVGYFHGA